MTARWTSLALALVLACAENEESGSKGTDTDAQNTSQTETSTHSGSAGTRAQGVAYGYFAIHLDPGGSPATPAGEPNHARGLDYFDDLVSLVKAADEGGHKLTLMFTAQWASYVLSGECTWPPAVLSYQGSQYSTCLELVRAFEAKGHEIAFHHHPKDAPSSWDGYTNSGDDGSADYLGDVDDLMAWVAQVPVAGKISLRAGTTEEYPSDHNLMFMGARGPTAYVDATDLGDLASTPCAWEEGGNLVWRLRMRSYSGTVQASVRGELSKAVADLENVSGPFTVGFVTHARDVGTGLLAAYVELFDSLSAQGIKLEGLTTVAGHYSWTAGEPDPTSAYACPEDEAL